MAVAAQLGHRRGPGPLRVRIVAGLALDANLTVLAGIPFILGRRMAGGTKLSIGLDGHRLNRVALLEGSVAGFAGHTLEGVLVGGGVVAGGVTGQAGKLAADLGPVLLEDR